MLIVRTVALTFRAGRNFNIQPWKVGERSGAKTPSMCRTVWKILVAGKCSVSRQILASFSKKTLNRSKTVAQYDSIKCITLCTVLCVNCITSENHNISHVFLHDLWVTLFYQTQRMYECRQLDLVVPKTGSG